MDSNLIPAGYSPRSWAHAIQSKVAIKPVDNKACWAISQRMMFAGRAFKVE